MYRTGNKNTEQKVLEVSKELDSDTSQGSITVDPLSRAPGSPSPSRRPPRRMSLRAASQPTKVYRLRNRALEGPFPQATTTVPRRTPEEDAASSSAAAAAAAATTSEGVQTQQASDQTPSDDASDEVISSGQDDAGSETGDSSVEETSPEVTSTNPSDTSSEDPESAEMCVCFVLLAFEAPHLLTILPKLKHRANIEPGPF